MQQIRWLAWACMLFVPALTFAGPIASEDVTFKSGDETMTGYRAEAAADAWNRMVDFFNRTLK